MKTLFIDTHLFNVDIILFSDNKIMKSEHIENKKHNSTLIMPMIKKVCPDKDFDQIVVVIGPGSFTGVRLGVTIAKTLAYTLNKKLIPITVFDMYNLSSKNEDNLFAMNEGNGYYVAKYENHLLKDDIFYLSNKEYQDYKESKHIVTSVAIDYEMVISKVSPWRGVNPHGLKPIYIKKIGVEQ